LDLATFQIVCVPIIGLAYALHLRGLPRGSRVGELGVIAFLFVCAWGAEETSILRYQMYAYPEGWWAKLDEVPVLVAAIWPMVILSARAVVRALFPRARGLALAGLVGLAVTWDASLVEVVAVDGGLWGWREGGYFGVPPIGILGWGCFAASATLALEWVGTVEGRGAAARARSIGAPRGTARAWLATLAAPAVALGGTHLLLVAWWWLAFRWIGPSAWPELAVVGFAVVGAGLALAFPLKRERVPLGVALPRMCAAAAFIAQLAARGDQAPLVLWVHAGAVAAPYLATVRWGRRPAIIRGGARESA
jgi:hypothetical protein